MQTMLIRVATTWYRLRMSQISAFYFYECGSFLKTVTIPSSVLTIQYGSFYGTSIESLDIPTTVQDIGHDVFVKSSVKSLVVNAKRVGKRWFEGIKTSLVDLTLDSNDTFIEKRHFKNVEG